MVGVGRVGCEHFRLMCVKLLLLRCKGFPLGQDVVRPGRKLSTSGNHAEPLLVRENLLAKFIPAHVELALELLNPFLRGLMRRVGATGNVIDKEWFVGR